MKTSISIPDDICHRAEQMALRRKISRSALITTAVSEYLDRHLGRDVTAKLDELYANRSSELDEGTRALQQASVLPEKW